MSKKIELKPETGLAQDYDASGFQPWYNQIDAEVASESTCECCGHKGLNFRGFQKNGTKVAVAICRNHDCRNEFEF